MNEIEIDKEIDLRGSTYKPEFDPDQVRQNLIMVMESMGLLPNFENFGTMAEKLSKVAEQDPAWTAKYIHSVYKGYKGVKASPVLGRAVLTLAMLIDNTPPGVAGAGWVRVLAMVDKVPEGTLIPRTAEVVKCANPACPVIFVKDHPFRRYHDPECQAEWQKERRKRGL